MNSFGTIVARNYMGHARMLAQSFRVHHPNDIFVCLVTDAHPGQKWEDTELDQDGSVRIISPAELELSAQRFLAMAYMYDVIELATALKPFLLTYLSTLHDAQGSATYLDPDTFVYSPVPEASTCAAGTVALLTPHRLSPPPLDEQHPQEQLFLRHGAYNLGYISVRKAGDMLAWWGDRLTTECIVAHRDALFTDQKWMDLAPTYFQVDQLRHPGVNLAWWNLDDRLLERDDAGVTVSGQPLTLAHFSGYRANRPPPEIRTRTGEQWLASRRIFEALAATYLEQAVEAQGPVRGQAPYGFERHADGQLVTPYHRRRFRQQARLQMRRHGTVPRAPWEGPSRTGRTRIRAYQRVDSWLGVRLPWWTIESELRLQRRILSDRVHPAKKNRVRRSERGGT